MMLNEQFIVTHNLICNAGLFSFTHISSNLCENLVTTILFSAIKKFASVILIL